MACERIRRRVVVRGRVQGVGFRGSTQAEARRVGVDGWVRNLSDGDVEAVFEGEEAAVAALLAFCRHGPAWAEVSGVEVVEEAPTGDGGFRVRR